MHVDSLVSAAVGLAPHFAEQLALRHDPSHVGSEIGEQIELHPGQLEGLAFQTRHPPVGVDRQLTDNDGAVTRLATGPTVDSSDSRLELAAGEGFDHVVVGAGVEQLDHFRLVVSCGGHDDRDS